jgi:hypothetical protein
LQAMRDLLAVHGRLSTPLVLATPGMASPATYRRRFGSFRAIYEHLGYEPSPRQRSLMATLGRPVLGEWRDPARA